VVRAGTVVAMAMAIGALSLIALVMGVFAALPAPTGTSTGSCGHLLDGTRRSPPSPAGCDTVLHGRRVQVAVAAGVAGAAAVVGATAFARVVAERQV
jgi:hypothetical protein